MNPGLERQLIRGLGWLVDDSEYVETRDDTGILGGPSLRVVEVGRHSHHSIVYVMTQVGLSSLLREEVGPVTGIEIGHDEGKFGKREHVAVELRSLAGNYLGWLARKLLILFAVRSVARK